MVPKDSVLSILIEEFEKTKTEIQSKLLNKEYNIIDESFEKLTERLIKTLDLRQFYVRDLQGKVTVHNSLKSVSDFTGMGFNTLESYLSRAENNIAETKKFTISTHPLDETKIQVPIFLLIKNGGETEEFTNLEMLSKKINLASVSLKAYLKRDKGISRVKVGIVIDRLIHTGPPEEIWEQFFYRENGYWAPPGENPLLSRKTFKRMSNVKTS